MVKKYNYTAKNNDFLGSKEIVLILKFMQSK